MVFQITCAFCFTNINKIWRTLCTYTHKIWFYSNCHCYYCFAYRLNFVPRLRFIAPLNFLFIFTSYEREHYYIWNKKKSSPTVFHPYPYILIISNFVCLFVKILYMATIFRFTHLNNIYIWKNVTYDYKKIDSTFHIMCI